MLWLLERLEEFPGSTWQQRWNAAGLNDPDHPVEELAGNDPDRRTRFTAAAQHAYCMRLIQPSAAAVAATRLFRYVELFRRVAGDPLLEEFCQRLERHPVTTERQTKATLDVCAMLTLYGVDMEGLTAEAVMHYAEQASGSTATATAWPVLHEMGRFPVWAPRTLQDARVRGQQSIETLVGRHQLRNAAVRDLLIDYLRQRSVAVDYSTLDNLLRNLVQYFWKVVEDINPGQANLRLDAEMTEFEEHFDKRRVELGSCGRPYGTPCAHEHACIRCPMLSINPTMLAHLDELEEGLLARRQRAIDEGWRGEVEGIELTLTFLRRKREQAYRTATMSTVSLGMPGPPRR